MSGGLLLQYLAVALAVVLSAGYVVLSRFPGTVRRLRVALALPLLRAENARPLRALGRWLAPRPSVPADACGSGCDGCDPRAKPRHTG